MENKIETSINLMRLGRVLNTISAQVSQEIESVHSTFKTEEWKEVLNAVNNVSNNIDMDKIRNSIKNNIYKQVA